MPSKCLQNAFKMPSKRLWNAFEMPLKHLWNVSKVVVREIWICVITLKLISNIWNAFKMPWKCFQNAFKTPSKRLQNAFKTPLKQLQNAFKMPPIWFFWLDGGWLCSKCTGEIWFFWSDFLIGFDWMGVDCALVYRWNLILFFWSVLIGWGLIVIFFFDRFWSDGGWSCSSVQVKFDFFFIFLIRWGLIMTSCDGFRYNRLRLIK